MDILQEFDRVLGNVTSESTKGYRENLSSLIGHVNRVISKRSDLASLIGENPLSVMTSNHENHAQFISSLFEVKSVQTFLRVVTWVYKSYIARGFSPDYFPAALTVWQEAVNTYLKEDEARPIYDFYALMIKHHGFFLEQSKSEHKIAIKESVLEYYDRFLKALLIPDMRASVKIASEYIKEASNIAVWYEDVILPAMYEMGNKWAKGEINVGQEHMATSIVQRVMSMFYPMLLDIPKNKGGILVASSAGELHEIGARMVSDFLEMNGWDVYYCGADTPDESVFAVLAKNRIHYLCVSTTITYNLKNVRKLIAKVKKEDPSIYVIVGGQAYFNDYCVWKSVGADGFAESGRKLVEYMSHV